MYGDDSTFSVVPERTTCQASLEPWPKLFNALRSTRETELEEEFPSHVVCAWMGHSRQVSQKHYLQVTEEHFARGSGTAAEPRRAVEAQLKVPRKEDAGDRTLSISRKKPHAERKRTRRVDATGLEPVTSSV